MTDDALDLKGMTADIVASFVTGNPIPAADLPGLISKIYAALADVDASEPVVAEVAASKTLTAGQIGKSIAPDAITCFACGKRFKTLRRHIMAEHGMTPGAYIAAWNLPRDYPMVAETTSALRRTTALATGLGRKTSKPPVKAARKK